MAERVVISRSKNEQAASDKDIKFLKKFLSNIPDDGDASEFIHSYRRSAWQEFENLPVPSTTDEAWRRTDLRALNFQKLTLAQGDGSIDRVQPLPPAELLDPLIGDKQGGQIVLQTSEITRYLDPLIADQGVVFTDFQTALREYPQILERILGKVVRSGDGKFAALTAALSQRGVLVFVPKGVRLEAPLHSILWGPGNGLLLLSHLLIYVDDGASLTYVHESASDSINNGQSMHAGIVEIHVGQEAALNFVELQSWGTHIWNISHERAEVERDGNLEWIFGSLGSRLTKNFSEINLVGEGARGRMSGFYFSDKNQHLDHDTQQNHLARNTTSDLLFKGALRDQSRSVWQGMIYVAPGAQKADGYQANRNLVLSREARADSIPGLEILADDVRCTHGATAGKIDPDQLFYLRSRGIPTPDAERLIVEGFFDPIMQRIPFEGVRQRFIHAIEEKMG